jgi:hypothetical protein
MIPFAIPGLLKLAWKPLAIILAFVAVCAFCYNGGRIAGRNAQALVTAEVQHNLDVLRESYSSETAKLSAKILAATKKQRETTNAQQKDFTDRLNALRDGVRNTPGNGSDTQAAVPGSSGGADAAATGPESCTPGAAALDALSILLWQKWYKDTKKEWEQE